MSENPFTWQRVAGVAAGGLLLWAGVKALRSDERSVRVRRAITVSRSPDQVYLFWRRLENLPLFIDHIESVEWLSWDTTHWVAREGVRRFSWGARMVADEPGKRIAWCSLPGAELENEGEVRFVKAPGGRGTEIHVDMTWAAPAGGLGLAVAPLLRRIADVQLGQELHRLRQLLETGELATGVRLRGDAPTEREPIRNLRRYGQPVLEASAAAEVE